ncbi:sterile alpha motif domain-containing protein 9-like [Rhineura floridana]|uniref:sterile alpha motif domain-containing protein 9-like n=1 Tax=Rhineura floridana TaxID=261503 RepID=UPI002AC828DE|nr:sterile alpha motif domain-containing protein 9-like [Rhineura floridana]XP_061443236.1 sterile alpha motif domain-containing protein 9-like [Rhineura floridana]XP_061443237.1 sterile alpha motif domain-containing protein 9-like [Rhineura floridana]
MEKKRIKNKNIKKREQLNLPEKIEDWTKEHVQQWVMDELKLEEKHGDILFHQDVTGTILKLLTKQDLKEMGITYGPACQIMHALKKMVKPGEDPSKDFGHEHSTGPLDTDSSIKNKNGGAMEENGKRNSASDNEQPVFARSECTEPPESVLQETTKNTVHQGNGNNQLPTRQTCLPYPFDEFHNSHRYIQQYVLHIPETGPLNLIDPVHEFKLFTNTKNATEEDLKMKFGNEIFRFAAACMNSRTNGTIHLGVRDNPHGEIVGVKVQNKEKYISYFDSMLKQYFGNAVIGVAKDCIRKPRFVEVLQQNSIPSETFVIEIDVVPKYSSCQSKYFPTKSYNFKTKEWESSLFIRDGASSKNLLKSNDKTQYKSFMSKLDKLAEDRKEAEGKHGEKRRTIDGEGQKLVSLLTGNRDLLDNSYYNWYILVTNKCHPHQTQHINFLQEIKLFAVLEFDPESASNGVVRAFRENRAANLHFPKQYQKPGNSSSETIEELNLYQQPSWIFCNGRSDLNSEAYQPLSPRLWQQQKAAEVRKLISFLSHPDIMQRGKFLVIFLLLSKVEDPGDPMIEAFCAFYQELKGLDDMLCICIGAQTYLRWKDLLQARFIEVDPLANRCISHLSLSMVNGTIQKLKSVTQTSQRLLPSKGFSSTILSKKEEDFMTALEILCENECKDTEIEKDKERFSEFKKSQEEHFYRGGKVSWWNFYFSSENYCLPFIKRDAYEKLEYLIESQSPKMSPTKIINLYHHPGCGGTTLAMHILWELRKKFRCAVLKNKTVDFGEIGTQLTTLLTYGTANKFDYLPVLLLVDDFEEQENVSLLENAVQKAVAEKRIMYENPLVIILNCMRSQNPGESSKSNSLNSIALKQKLSLKEQRAFEEKLKEIEEQYDHPEDFYSFMIMKKNFDQQYIENVVKNTLKGFDTTSKRAQLISFLALLNSYVTESTISVSQCEEFLGISTKKAYWGTESLDDKMGNCSNIIIQTEVQERGRYKGVRISHSLIAGQCLEEFKQTYKLTKSEITLLLLRESLLYDTGIGRDKLQQDVQSMLLTRHRKEHGDDTDTLFSPLIEAIQKEERGTEVEKILTEGTRRFSQNVFISQALARHFYIKEKKFNHALEWARKAKKGAPNNSYISDTLGQVYKSEIKHWLEENAEKSIITVEILKHLLNLAKCAADAFKESQQQTENKDSEREFFQNIKYKRRYEMYNTSGYLGEIETGLYTIEIIESTPFFNKKDELSRKHIVHFLSGNGGIPKATGNTESEEYRLTLEEYANYLSNLQANLKKAFDFFENYFVFLKPKNPEKEIVELKIRRKVQEFFKKYAEVFCHSDFDWLMNSKLSSSLQGENYRKSLEASKADKFSGILEYLSNHENATSRMEDIVKKYTVLLDQNSTKSLQRDKLNFILANIVLRCLNPKSKMVQSFLELKEQLRTILQAVGLEYRFSEPYFLASLLFWPENQKQLDKDSKQMEKFLNSLKKAFNGQYWQMCRSKQPIAFFYLGKGSNLNKFVHKGKIDQSVTTKSRTTARHRMSDELSALWQSGEIWKTENAKHLLLRLNGKAEDNLVYVDYGIDEDIRIPARPVFLGQLKSGRSIERVSFYLGFSIGGLIAYDIEII